MKILIETITEGSFITYDNIAYTSSLVKSSLPQTHDAQVNSQNILGGGGHSFIKHRGIGPSFSSFAVPFIFLSKLDLTSS